MPQDAPFRFCPVEPRPGGGAGHDALIAVPPNGQMMRCRAARIRVMGARASPDRAIATRGCGPLQLGLCVPIAPRIARILRLILDFQTPFHEDREGRLASWRITALDPTPRPLSVFSACCPCFVADWSHDFTRVRAGARFRAYDRRAAWTGPAAADTLRSRGFQARSRLGRCPRPALGARHLGPLRSPRSSRPRPPAPQSVSAERGPVPLSLPLDAGDRSVPWRAGSEAGVWTRLGAMRIS